MSDGGGAATRGAHGSTARDDGRPHRVVADAQFGTDLDQGESADMQAGRLFTNRLRQHRHAGWSPARLAISLTVPRCTLNRAASWRTGTPSEYAASSSARFEALKRV